MYAPSFIDFLCIVGDSTDCARCSDIEHQQKNMEQKTVLLAIVDQEILVW